MRLRDLILKDQAGLLFTADDSRSIEEDLLRRLLQLPPGGLLLIDFEGARVASEAARQLLRRALLRTTSGELEDRFLLLTHLDSVSNILRSSSRDAQCGHMDADMSRDGRIHVESPGRRDVDT